MSRYLSCLILLCLSTSISAQEISASELLRRSIAFHDPDSRWAKQVFTFLLHQDRPDGTFIPAEVMIDNWNSTFRYNARRNGQVVTMEVESNDSARVMLDWNEEIDSLKIESMRLTRDRARWTRNYYSFLYGLPMKLRDPGTIIDPAVKLEEFQGQDVLAMRVTYDESVGSDIWYFYFHPATYALVGYRFYHDEQAGDGEYIVCDGMFIGSGMRIPKDRTWYTNQGDTLLGADKLMHLRISQGWRD